MKTICTNNCDNDGPVKECDRCKSMYCGDCFDYDCPKCMEDMGNKIIARAETGAMKFGDDWPGVFIRGDNAAYYAMNLKTVLSNGDFDIDGQMAKIVVQGLLSDLESCIEPVKEVQALIPYVDCQVK